MSTLFAQLLHAAWNKKVQFGVGTKNIPNKVSQIHADAGDDRLNCSFVCRISPVGLPCIDVPPTLYKATLILSSSFFQLTSNNIENDQELEWRSRLAAIHGSNPDSRYSRLLASDAIRKYLELNRKRGLYNCNHCAASFQLVYDLALHFDDKQVQRDYPCRATGCPYGVLNFSTVNERNRHESLVHGEKRNVCDICHQAFSRVDQLNAHIQRTHKNPNSRYNRKLLKKQGKTKRSLPSLSGFPDRKLSIDYLIN